MRYTHKFYKILREEPGSNPVRLLSLIPSSATEIVYDVRPGAVTRAPNQSGLYIFVNQTDMAQYIRRNAELYHLWVFLVYCEGMVPSETCLKAEYIQENQKRYWDQFYWSNTLAHRLQNNRNIETYKLMTTPSGTGVSHAIEIIQPLYYQPIPAPVLYEPVPEDLARIGWA